MNICFAGTWHFSIFIFWNINAKNQTNLQCLRESEQRGEKREKRNKADLIIWLENFCRMKIWSITTKQIQRSNASSFRSEHFDQSWCSRVFPHSIPYPLSVFPMHNKFKVLFERYLQFEFQFKIETLAVRYC